MRNFGEYSDRRFLAGFFLILFIGSAVVGFVTFSWGLFFLCLVFSVVGTGMIAFVMGANTHGDD